MAEQTPEPEYRRNPDGSITTSMDLDADGVEETVTAKGRTREDGTVEVEIDVNGDGRPDAVASDDNKDGEITLDEVRPAE
ncbi:hypothetical protein [Allonocardiopsis opalescens]|uniref:EF hand domain-containing protein n=1 Tax=Allonocardiopsis opalescens TaxID=1144618 RepID=A0A2T0PXE7_9ACTN|nr:hypothetical protein [Allonocardiopsis opalescens]PRX96066.1 hypothetical protein CLV72_10870 [Allonocardiopsis opalescens]